MNAITKGGYQDVPMTRRRAQLLEEYASKLADMLEAAPNDKDLAEWVQSKIDRAAAAIQSAYHYLDQDDESELEKAVGHKYTHRKLIGRDQKTGRARYRYYYAEHQGGGISRAKFEAGSAFKLTWKGRRGHFHIDRVEGDQIFITHDSRPRMEPVPVQADELRALLTKQHSKAEQRHVEKRQREVEEIKRRAHRGGLGLALHRLRQAAAQAGVSLPEQYQRKPKKTRAKVAETAREVEAPKSATLINDTNFPTLPPDRRGAGFMTYGGETFRETPSIDGALFSFTPGTLDRWLRGKDAQSILEGIYRKTAEIAKQADSTVDIEEEYESLVEYAEKNARRIFHSPFTDEAKKMSFALKDLQEALEKDKYKKDEPPLTILNEILATLNDLSSQVPTPRNELKDIAQQIIEDANQEHGERHDEHQEITRFELGEHTHTKTGAKLYTAKQTERVERDEYFRRLEIAKKHGGRYERRYVRGFVFKTAEDARAFALEVEGAAQEAPETSAETVTPHDEHPGADNFETMPEVESAPTQRLRGVLDALSESERLNTINPKNRKRPKEAKGADAKLIKLINELAEDQDPNERRFLKVMASMLQDVKKQYPRSAYERRESRKDRYATIREFIEKKLGVEPTATAPNLGEILSRPTTPSTRPASAYYGRATKKLVDQALSSEPTGIDLNNARSVLPSKGDLREMLSQEQRLKRAKEDLVSTGAPNFLGQRNPIQDIMYALDRYLNGPYVELGQGRIREMERGLKIALRDSKGEELEQVKDETARFWREWGGEYKRLQEEFARGRTQGQALRNIRPLIPKHALTPEINQQLDQMEQELDQRPVTGHDIARWIDTRDTNQATRDRQPKTQPTTPREQLTETAREVTQGADNFETMPEVESAPRSKTPAPKTRADLARLIHQELLSAGFKGANLWIKNEGTGREKARVYLSGKGRKQGMIEALSSQEYGSEGAFRLQVIQEEGLEGASDEEIQAAIDRRSSALDLKLTPPKLDPEQLQKYLEAISAVARKLKDSAPKILDPSDRPTLALTLDYTETPLAQRSREELETLRTRAQQVNSRESRPQDRNENTHAVSVAQHIIREVNIALGETTAQSTQPTTPREQLTETAREVTQGADNFETMPEVEAPKSSARERELFNIVYDKTLDRKQAVKKRHRQAYLDLIEKRPIGGEERRALIELGREYTGILQQLINAVEIPGVSKGDTYAKLDAYAETKGIAYTDRRSSNYAEAAFRVVIQDILKSGPYLDERRTRADFVRHITQKIAAFEQAAQKQSAPSMEKVRAPAPPQAATTPTSGTVQRQSVLDAAEEAQRLDAQGGSKRSAAAIAADERLAETIRNLISNEYQGVEDVTRSDKPRRQWTVKERELNSLIDRLETLQSAKKRTRSMTAATAQNIRETTRGRLIDEMRRRIETDSRIKPTAPARQALTETAERVTSDQTAEQATTRATPRPSEETLRGSGELDETVRANLQDRAQYLLRMPEDTTKTGRRSKAQKARDGELLLIHRRLQSDAQERLGPTAPRFADYSQLVGMPRADQPENAETRAQFRTALKDAIRELEQATSGQVTKSARPLITYRAQLIQTVERLTAA